MNSQAVVLLFVTMFLGILDSTTPPVASKYLDTSSGDKYSQYLCSALMSFLHCPY